MLMEQNMSSMLAQRLRIHPFCKSKNSKLYSDVTQHDCADIQGSTLIKEWTDLANSVDQPESECRIAMVGKYVDQGDACEKIRFVLPIS